MLLGQALQLLNPVELLQQPIVVVDQLLFSGTDPILELVEAVAKLLLVLVDEVLDLLNMPLQPFFDCLETLGL